MGMVGEACLPSNAYYPRTPDYTLCSGVHVCWSEHSDSSFVYGFMILDYGFGTMTATTFDRMFLELADKVDMDEILEEFENCPDQIIYFRVKILRFLKVPIFDLLISIHVTPSVFIRSSWILHIRSGQNFGEQLDHEVIQSIQKVHDLNVKVIYDLSIKVQYCIRSDTHVGRD